MATIDLTTDDVVLEYVEGKVTPSGVPARDLNGADLAHYTYRVMLAELDPRAEGFARPTPTPGRAATVAATLVAGGAFVVPRGNAAAAKPAKKAAKKPAKAAPAAEPTTEPTPAEPAAEPEA